MSSNEYIPIAYDEWTLKQDSSPGWDIIPGIVRNILKTTGSFKGWVYNYESKTSQYVKAEEFDYKDKHLFPGAISKYIKKNALCMIRTIFDLPIEQLLSAYCKVSSGIIEKNLQSEVFAAPVEAGDWIRIAEGNIMLVICHDGDPIFVLRKPTDTIAF